MLALLLDYRSYEPECASKNTSYIGRCRDKSKKESHAYAHDKCTTHAKHTKEAKAIGDEVEHVRAEVEFGTDK